MQILTSAVLATTVISMQHVTTRLAPTIVHVTVDTMELVSTALVGDNPLYVVSIGPLTLSQIL